MDIQHLIIKSLFNTLTAEEQKTLDAWRQIPGNEAVYGRISEGVSMPEDVASFLDSIPVEEALTRITDRCDSVSPIARKPMIRYQWVAAAVILLFLAGGWWLMNNRLQPKRLVINAQVARAIQQTRAGGRQGADSTVMDLTTGDTKTIDQNIRNVTSAELRKVFPEQELDAVCKLTTYYNKEYWLTLDDGTLIHLNTNTRVIFPERFGKKRRDVVLDGEAYFMVAPDKHRPFTIHTPQGNIRVYGTEFCVNTKASDEGGATSVVLIKGAISVKQKDGNEHPLKPREKGVMRDHALTLTTVDTTPYEAWNIGYLTFEDYPLDELMDVLTKWYGVEVIFKNETTCKRHFTGKLNRYGKLESMIRAIGNVTGIDIERNNNTIIIN